MTAKKTTYTISTVNQDFGPDFTEYLFDVAPKLSAMFDNKLDYRNCPVRDLIDKYIFLICRRNGVITGHMILNLFSSPLDRNVKILYQVSFHAKPDSGRTAYHLFQKFIDIGRKQANHVITMLTSQTNIKPSTLENMGFKELETLYRLEV